MASINSDDRIRELCFKAAATTDSHQLSPILEELRATLQEQQALAKSLVAERTRMLSPRVLLSRK
jgi:hypothetical protein